jgi:tetratricopeptide (TPR) repeat protein
VFTAELDIQLGKYHKALKLLQDLLPMVKKSSHLCSQMAFCYAQIGQTKQSITFLESALEALEEEQQLSHQVVEQILLLPATPSLIYYNLGANYSKLQKMTEALQSYEKSLLLQPNFVLAMTGIIHILSQYMNKYDEAYNLAKRAMTYDNSNLYLKLLLGICCVQKGSYEEGVTYLAVAPQEYFRLKIVRIYYYYKAKTFNSIIKSFLKIKTIFIDAMK